MSDAAKGMTVEEMIVALVRTKEPDAIPEFTLDDEHWFRVQSIDLQADGNVTLDVVAW